MERDVLWGAGHEHCGEEGQDHTGALTLCPLKR
jgi:hypothetical protein